MYDARRDCTCLDDSAKTSLFYSCRQLSSLLSATVVVACKSSDISGRELYWIWIEYFSENNSLWGIQLLKEGRTVGIWSFSRGFSSNFSFQEY